MAVLAACTATPAPAPSPVSQPLTGDLVDPVVRQIEVGENQLTVAWAADTATRARGLSGVEDLGDIDGMLFDLEAERSVTFNMDEAVIPLDIYFFDSDGAMIGSLAMEPCRAEPCPSYGIDKPSRWALEVPAGTLRVPDGARLDLG